MDLSKKSQLAYRHRKHAPKHGVPKEAPLQRQLNETLEWLHIPYLRIPDGFWAWLHGYSNATPRMKSEVGHYLSGWADNLCFLPLGDGYCLCLMIELKAAKGKLHKSQKRRDKKTPCKVCRTPDENVEALEEFQALAEKLSDYCKRILSDQPQ